MLLFLMLPTHMVIYNVFSIKPLRRLSHGHLHVVQMLISSFLQKKYSPAKSAPARFLKNYQLTNNFGTFTQTTNVKHWTDENCCTVNQKVYNSDLQLGNQRKKYTHLKFH